jgi:hypothetical protein
MGVDATAHDASPPVTAGPSRLGAPIDRPAMLIRALLLYVGYATRPSFLIVGAQKAGTTALHAYLRAHPHVVAGTTKEIGFFSPEAIADWPEHPHYGVLCGDGDPVQPLASRRKRAWYHSHFPLPYRLGRRIAFEATPEYLYVPEAAQRIRDYKPEMKLIVLVREPASRALAAWNMYRNWGSYRPEVYAHRTETRSFAEAVETELSGLEAGTAPREPGYVQRGLYAEQIARYLGLFGRDRVLVLAAEALAIRTDATLDRVARFLELPPFPKRAWQRVHVGGYKNGPADVSETLGRLKAFYAPHNASLWELIDERFDWA